MQPLRIKGFDILLSETAGSSVKMVLRGGVEDDDILKSFRINAARLFSHRRGRAGPGGSPGPPQQARETPDGATQIASDVMALISRHQLELEA